jgi:hypothetical protein
MLGKSILKRSTILWVLIIFSTLAWGAQTKPTGPARKPAAPAKPAAQKPAPPAAKTGKSTPSKRPATGKTNRPATGTANRPAAGGHTPLPTTAPHIASRITKTFTDLSGHPASATFRPGGGVATIHANGMTIDYGLHCDRTVVAERNGRTIVSTGRGGGCVQPSYLTRNGRTYYERTYWDHGHAYARVYRDHFYHGVHYYSYVPSYYYHPVFYNWACNPWGAPVYYNWGWGPDPRWFYGGYFAPAPFYPSATLWLTDYLFAEDLKHAYEGKQEAQARAEADRAGSQRPEGGAPAQAQLSPDQIKEMVDAEVQRQLAEESAAAQTPPDAATLAIAEVPPAALDPKQRLFVVSSNHGVTTAEGQECELTPGDVITRIDDNPTGSSVRVSVMSSKQDDCTVGAMPLVAVDDLQEMHNSFHAQVDSGLQTLAANAGTNGLPKAPDTQTQAGEVRPPAPDSGAAAQLVVQQADQSGGGYVQRAYLTRNGRTYYQRTYVVGGRSYARVYRGYYYHGVRYYGYVPGYYYHPVFYGWAYNPWVSPVYYSPMAWGWAGAPWFGFYGGFFTPYPVYASASLWLTDYLIAANLQAAYQAQAEANAAAAAAAGPPPADNSGAPSDGGPAAINQTPLSPEVKQAIADEVQRQLAAEKDAAANPQAAAQTAPASEQVPDALNPAERVFVVATNLDVSVPTSGQECSLTAGDVVMRLSDTPDTNQNVTVTIQSTKKADCPTGQTVAIGVQDLQEMHNQLLERLDDGLKTLADNGGTGGLPKPPDTGTTAGEVPPPAPDSGAAAQLSAQQQQADQTQSQVQQATPQ